MNAAQNPDIAALQQRAEAAGVALAYTSYWGEPQSASPALLARILDALGEPAADAAAPAVVEAGTVPDIALAAPWRLRQAEGDGRIVAEGAQPGSALPGTLAPGYYRLEADGAPERLLIVAPQRCWVPEGIAQGERWWGLSIQLYALRSETNWGIGDFSDLAALVALSAAQGAAFIGLSPLHALHAHAPEQASSYSPSSRTALNTLFIDVAAVPEFAHCAAARTLVTSTPFQQKLEALRAADEVRYADVAAAKEQVLALLWTHFTAHELVASSGRAQAFLQFTQENEALLGAHALHEAIQLRLHAADPSVWGWPAWPEELRDPHGAGAAAFRRDHGDAVRYRFWLQWLAHEQLALVQRQARRLLPLGLYCDLAVGAASGGSETWAQQKLYAHGLHVGAPPDPLNALGQDWGLPPLRPQALAAAGFAPFIALLRAVMRPAGALRMDHVMALMRLFWTTPDAGGTYVAYPLEALAAIVAVESQRQRCLVIGEDLGNVDPAMRAAMQQRGLLSYKPLIFERRDDGAFRPPAEWQPQALAVVTTHDLPTLSAFWAGSDIDTQARLNLLPGEEIHAQMVLARAQDRARLLLALQHANLLPEGVTIHPPSLPEATTAFVAAVHAYLARTPCWLAAVQIEDATGQREQVNVPGTTEDRNPNWRRRVAVPLSGLAAHPTFAAVAAAMRAERGRPAAVAAVDELPPLESADIPRATYRVQFHAGYTFADATRAVGYLHALGISHLYSSPYLKARPGSTHGYDVVDPTQLNPEVGTDAEHAALCDALAARGMGQVLDIVPNHMGVLEADNPWWQDLLEHGAASPHAATFDIEWNAVADGLQGRVLLPILGDHYGRVLESGELQLRFDAAHGRFAVHYWGHHAPIDPQHYGRILSVLPAPVSGNDGDSHALAEVQSLLDAFSHLPQRDAVGGDSRAARLRDAPLLQRRLAEAAAAHGWLREWIRASLLLLNGHAGDTASFDALDALLHDQAYRLADWRVAGDDINYRRFFDVNGLAAVRMEEPAVFEATHARVLQWLADGRITGLRIDHPDGLADPGAYLARLQSRHAAQARAAGREPRALYVVVEKILADHEPLPEDWPVHGDTGYRFASLVNGLFVEPASKAAFDDAYAAFTDDVRSYEDTAYACKKLIIDTTLASDLGWLTETLYRIVRADRRACDFTRHRLRAALAEVAAGFPVYRTYVGAHGEAASAADARHIAWAVAAAARRLGSAERGLLDYLGPILSGEDGPEPALRRRFVRRWQQFTAPVMAKSIEDTTFYRHVRLASLNDVGSEPRRFGISAAAFHATNLQVSRRRPHPLLATSTHDSKRSEDVRARLNVLSEIPALWEDTVLALSQTGERLRTTAVLRADAPAPSRADEWSLYQALVGIWPAGPTDAAAREAKRETNWLCPDEAYEAALDSHIDRCLASEGFVQTLEAFVQAIAPYGFRNSLAQLALKLTAPGVPDIYQGCEQWNFSLVDPDNRRPVDFDALAAGLAEVQALHADGAHPTPAQWQDLLPAVPAVSDGRIKQLVTWRLLQLRAAQADLFRHGSYLPLAVVGPAEVHAIGFARIREGRAVVVIAARLLYGLAAGGWRGTRIAIAAAHPALEKTGAWRNLLTGAVLPPEPGDGYELDSLLGEIGPATSRLPFAVLVPA
ncbi:malto-oligosyltrehalose synthase [Xylophilus sp.]|uniref:malto-oligosyltrehalose synthase n=1 Tax=Xylophilus sp. TaxID=2653893 RepID=UPI0013BD55BE|nr:malto-oligosyltrehalose synthase [Xylophilus sp.]KAF1049875.1 MAG: 4-alpha-glucanotransferase [Xylophilus sp.]